MQAQLRKAFARWGLPGRLRVDNGCPWGATGGLPTELALWLFGLGVEVTWNRPRRPQQNGVVERSQGVSKRWAEPHTCADAAELRRRLGEMDAVQREEYPSIGGKSRSEAFPGLAHSGRPYSRGREAREWSPGRALGHVAEYVVVRRVDGNGKVSLYDRGHWVGKQWSGQDLYVSLDPDAVEWVFTGRDGREVRRRPASELTQANIVGLRVSRPRGAAGGAR